MGPAFMNINSTEAEASKGGEHTLSNGFEFLDGIVAYVKDELQM